jgi:hypothetical protein
VCTIRHQHKNIPPDLHLGMAVCSEQDPFCKAKGRLIALGRAQAGSAHDDLAASISAPEDLECHGYDEMRQWALRAFMKRNTSTHGFVMGGAGNKALNRSEKEIA